MFRVTVSQLRRSSPSANPQRLDCPTDHHLRIKINPAFHKDPTSLLEAMITGEVRDVSEGRFIYSSPMKDLPQVLTFHVDVSEWNQDKQRKCLAKSFAIQHQVVVKESWMSEDAAQIKEVAYELTAVVKHIGFRPETGHYVAFVKRGELWFLCDDHNVTLADPLEVIASSTYESPHLLYYVEQSLRPPLSPCNAQPQQSPSHVKLPATMVSTPNGTGKHPLPVIHLRRKGVKSQY
jgi:hypothetical protein